MPQFLIGDELGNIKQLQYDSTGDTKADGGQPRTAMKTIYNTCSDSLTPDQSVQALTSTCSQPEGPKIIVAARANKTLTSFKWDGDEELTTQYEWRESRMKPDSRFIGLSVSSSNVYSCTSNGALRRTTIPENGSSDLQPSHRLTAVPTGLYAWRMSPNNESFSYGGDEVDLSVWNVEQAFTNQPSSDQTNLSSKKRKRNDALFPGEIWRARNVPNDHLGLRQPIRITSIAYERSASCNQLVTGTQLGDVRRYDIRAGKKPTANWKIFKDGCGVKAVEAGLNEHEIFVSDSQTRLFSIDTRNGLVNYGYKGISGAVTSIAVAQSLMVSTALDRYVRIHSTFPPPTEAGKSQENKGEVLDKVFMTSTPTVLICSQEITVPLEADSDGDHDDIWQNMEQADDEMDTQKARKQRKK